MVKIILIILSMLSSTSLIAERNYDISFENECNLLADLSDETRALDSAISSLDWKTEGKHSLTHSHSNLSIPEGYYLLTGEEAKKFVSLFNEPEEKQLEAIVIDPYFKDFLYLSHYNDGYVSLDAWGDIDADVLIAGIKANNEADNIERKKAGGNPLQIVGWVQPPKLDRHTVSWSIEINNGTTSFVNSVVIKLHRTGFESIIWGTNKETYTSPHAFKQVIKSFYFDPGFRYSDFANGDQIAQYDIASLVGDMNGAVVFKDFNLSTFLKKLALLIAIGALASIFILKEASSIIADNSIRKKWLYLHIFASLLSFLSIFFTEEFNFIKEVFSGCVSPLVMYYFAYKKHGTKLLTFHLIIWPICIPIILLGALIEMDLKTFSFVVIWLTIETWWLVLSYRLLKVNKKIRIQAIQQTPAYQHAVEMFQEISTVDELHAMFRSLMNQRHNDGHLNNEASIVRAFEIRKAAILMQQPQ